MPRPQTQLEALTHGQLDANGELGDTLAAPSFDTERSVSLHVEFSPRTLAMLDRIATGIEELLIESRRIADHLSPQAGDIVGTPFLAQQLGCSVVWAAEMARNGEIPKGCIVPGTGNGKPWKFYRRRIEEWLSKR